jgi:hypothetical protein
MRTAFKEWSIVVDALKQGEQIIILRKGGISEGRGGFQMEHEQFLLFPTRFHQQRDSVLPAAQARYDRLGITETPAETVEIDCYARVVTAECLTDLSAAERLRGQHIWRDEVIAERFDWGRSKSIYALAVRVYRLPRILSLPMLDAYGGCKSWIDLTVDVPVDQAQPVLDENAFVQRLDLFRASLAQISP